MLLLPVEHTLFYIYIYIIFWYYCFESDTKRREALEKQQKTIHSLKAAPSKLIFPHIPKARYYFFIFIISHHSPPNTTSHHSPPSTTSHHSPPSTTSHHSPLDTTHHLAPPHTTHHPAPPHTTHHLTPLTSKE